MVYVVRSSVAHSGTWYHIVATFAPTTDGHTDLHAWLAANDGNEMHESETKDLALDVPGAAVGFYINTADNALAQFPPASTTQNADVNRAEIHASLKEQLDKFPEKFFKLEATQARPEFVTRRVRNILAYASIDSNLTDVAKATLLKNEAKADLLEMANFAASAWLTAYSDDQTSFYEWTKPTTGAAYESVALPTANATLTAPDSASAITGVKPAQELS